MILQPLEQFKIILFFDIGLLISWMVIVSNFILYSTFICFFFYFLFKWSIIKYSFLNNYWAIFIEYSVIFVLDLIDQQIGKKGNKFFVLIFTLFFFIFMANLIGLLPYSFTTTSHVSQTFTLSLSLFLGVTFIGFIVQKLKFFELFVPKDVVFVLIPFLIIIEIISYISRAFSLAIRLFANMVSGHTLLNILAGFSLSLFNFKFYHQRIFAILPFFVIFIIFVLEFCISFLQAYVFAVLICIYLNDSLHGH
mgnify:CR=1 FL=1|tara:strand:- start:223 stop:975 length:753 start_codon:yes stop_codon:yes gene_type:complete